jgi:hypothetical protein
MFAEVDELFETDEVERKRFTVIELRCEFLVNCASHW